MKRIAECSNNLIFIYKQIFAVSKSRMFLIILQCCVSTLNMVVDIYFLKYIIEGLVKNYDYTYFIMVLAVKLGVLLAMQCCDNVFDNYIFKRSDIKIQKELALRLFNNIKKVRLDKIDDPEYYNKYQKAISEVSSRSNALLNYFTYILSTLLNIISLIAIISSLNFVLITISVVGMLVTVWANIANTKNTYKANMSFVGVDRKIAYIHRLFYLPQYAKDIRRTNLPNLLQQKYNDAISEKQDLIKKHWPKIIAVAISGSWLYNVVNVGGAYLYLAINAINKIISIGDVASLSYAINQLSNNLLQVSNIIPQAIQHSMYIQNYRDMLMESCEDDICYNQGNVEVKNYNDISFCNVSFKYSSSAEKAIDDISLSIKKGEHVAIVGENGSGKTTLIKLLCGLYNPYEGEILIGNMSYKKISFKSLSKLFGIVDQDFQHYAFSLAENIALPSENMNIDYNKIRDSLEMVNMSNIVSSLKNGVDSIYSKEFDESGVDFSGGQLQRLAIARAIYSDAEILVFDEPSSALDPINEQKLFDTIYKTCGEKTLILISHRLSCVKDTDRIIVMEKGKIVESGSHNELLRASGKYAQMYSIQAERYGM